jgi:hypothetical protein
MSETSDIKQIQSALHGYVAVDLAPPPGYGFGVSFYVTVWALLERPLKDFQVGLPSTWIQPENSDFKLPLCPIGTASRDDADKQEAYKKEHPEDKMRRTTGLIKQLIVLGRSFKTSKAVSDSGAIHFQLTHPSIESTAFQIATTPQ